MSFQLGVDYQPRGDQASAIQQLSMGLKEGEKVVVSGSYLLNSEFVIRKGSNLASEMPGMEGHDMKNMEK